MSKLPPGLIACSHCGAAVLNTSAGKLQHVCQPKPPKIVEGLSQFQEARVREIVREEIERLKDQIEHALGARP